MTGFTVTAAGGGLPEWLSTQEKRLEAIKRAKVELEVETRGLEGGDKEVPQARFQLKLVHCPEALATFMLWGSNQSRRSHETPCRKSLQSIGPSLGIFKSHYGRRGFQTSKAAKLVRLGPTLDGSSVRASSH